MRSIQSAIQSTCCSMDTIMLLSTEGLPGPVMANRLGNPATVSPRYVRGPSVHASFSLRPARPRMSMLSSAPVMASKPVANTMLSSTYAASRVRRPLQVRGERSVAGRDAEVRRALEDEQVRRLLGDEWDRLDGRGAGADHPDPLAAEVGTLMRPASRVIRGTPEAFPPRELRHLSRRQTPGRHDAEARRHAIAAVGRDGPSPAGLVEGRSGHPGRDLDVAPQVEAVGDVIDVGQNLRLGGVPLAPLPFLLQLVRERVRIVHALDVAARARVAIPVPGAADAVARLEDAGRQPELAQAVEHVEPGESGPDDDRVEIRHVSRLYAGNARVAGKPDREGSEPRETSPIRSNP